MSKRLFTDNQEIEICKLYVEDHFNSNELAKRFQCSPPTILSLIRRNGFKVRSMSEVTEGKFNHNWKGGRKKASNGYVMIFKPDHRNADPRGYVFEHRLIMEKHLGRFLKPEEVIHHVNGIITDNKIENLKFFTRNKDHLGWHKRERQETQLLQKDFCKE